MKNIWAFIISVSAFFYTSCSESKPPQNSNSTENIAHSTHEEPLAVNQTLYKKADVVPHDEVCMVNNAFMGKKQIEVNHNGKLYYGCCKMCEERIPQNESVRIAIDPVSKNQVDKADAVIAISGDNGEVRYFENKANYKAYFKK